MNHTLGNETYYDIRQPYSEGRAIVYGEGDMGWYDFVLIDSRGCVQERSDVQYGSPEIALRDALILASK